MAESADFNEVKKYKVAGIKVKGRELGCGSYATVQELEYLGLKCAGKKIHDLLLQQGDDSYTVRRFEEECRLLSQVRHPNIVQFLGVHFQPGDRVPILVMEFLPTNLTSCIEQYGILPKEISYSILHDVALGLCYLHSQTPPIIHRDLSSNNVLLSSNMTAKISDLGVARIFNNLTPLQVSRMTNTPGTPAYMPPEVMVANPVYDASIDEFSYGILIIHMLSGRWPEPQVGPNRLEEGKLVPVTEAERREVFLRAIGNEHPLMDLIKKCVDNDPTQRAHANEIVERAAALMLQCPTPFANRLEMEMLKHNDGQDEEKRKRKEAENLQAISKLKEEVLETNTKVKRLNLVHSSEMETLKFQVKDLNSQNRVLIIEKESEATQLRLSINSLQQEMSFKDDKIEAQSKALKCKDDEIEAQSKALEEKDSIISGMSEQLTSMKEYLTSNQQVDIMWKPCSELPGGFGSGRSIVINGKVYCGGGSYVNNSDQCIVYCYDTSEDNWTTLPPLPVKWFGLGQVNGQLVAVGGIKKDGSRSNEVYTYDDQSKEWKQTIPPMPTSRSSPGVLSLQSALVVAGGVTLSGDYTAAVEIFKPDTSQWYTADPLPTACEGTSLTVIGNTCYMLGGFIFPMLFNQALYTSVDDLLHNAVPTDQATPNRTQSAWKTLPNTPTYGPTATVLAGRLLAVGGREVSVISGAIKKKVYMYSPFTNSWIYVSDLPVPRASITIAVLSPAEILVIGGRSDRNYIMRTVFKGTLQLSDLC